jgi:hypothetical protein
MPSLISLFHLSCMPLDLGAVIPARDFRVVDILGYEIWVLYLVVA